MANIRAAQSGDFSATSTWVGGVVPGSGDVAYANTFTVTISDTRTVQAISNATGTSITAGGTFSLLNGCNLTCTNATGLISRSDNVSNNLISVVSLTIGQNAVINANNNTGFDIQQNGFVINFTSGGTLTVNGSFTAPQRCNAFIYLGGSGTLYVNGNLDGTLGGLGGVVGKMLRLDGSGTAYITGNVTAGASNGVYIASGSTANVYITGSAIGGDLSGYAEGAAANYGTGTLRVNGICQSGTASPAIGKGSTNQLTYLSGPFLLGASNNVNPIQAQSWRWAPTQIPTYMEVPTSGGSTKRNLYTSDNIPSTNYPTVSNVRSGVVYGPSNENTGTLAVPSPSAVSLGIATDNTVGTAILTAANVRTAVGLASANLDTQFTNIPAAVWAAATRTLTTTIPTAAEIAAAVWSAATRTLTSSLAPTVSEITSAVWSATVRTITGGTVDTLTNAPTVPSAAAIASQVRTELSTELGRIDVAVSSRLAPSGTLARVTLTDTVTTLTNAPLVPSAAAIASQVRTELTTELARLDVATSTRLAAASYSAAPTTAAIATAVWAAADKTGYSLTSTERQAIATAVEQSILNEGDGQAVLNAIVGAIGNINVDQVALIAAIRADIERSGGMLSSKSTLTAGQVWSNTTRTITGGTVDTLTNSPNVPSSQAIALQIRAELTPELERIANCATVETTANIVQDAVGD